MGASVVGQPFLVPNSSVMRETPGIKTGREAQYARRVKELEDELRTVRLENDKQVFGVRNVSDPAFSQLLHRKP
jgi:hypothetical protein